MSFGHSAVPEDAIRQELAAKARELLDSVDLRSISREEFLGARFDAGLGWLHFPIGLGGMGLPPALQGFVDLRFREAGAPEHLPGRNGIGRGMAAPTILACGTEEQQHRMLRPLWTGEHEYCQLFSEPGAGSDLAALATRADRDGNEWVVNGQKIWSSSAHTAQRAILLARTDAGAPKHAGLTFFICDMTVPGIEVRPLRQITGEAEFNEVFMTDVRISDADRLGPVGDGWRVASVTLSNERVVFGTRIPREQGMIGPTTQAWREHPELRSPSMHDELMRLWVGAEVSRLADERFRQRLASGQPGPEGSASKLSFARLAQAISGFEVQLRREDGLRYDDWTMRRPESVDFTGRQAGYRYLRARGNSLEGGSSEILRNIIAERVLGLPREARADKDVPWKDTAR
ncbi:MAG: acyl-CoA dehydrogenase family protein [Solirubrobacteraceae bacterium]